MNSIQKTISIQPKLYEQFAAFFRNNELALRLLGITSVPRLIQESAKEGWEPFRAKVAELKKKHNL